MDVLYGLHPVEEALRSGSRPLEKVIVARERRDERLERLIRKLREAGIPVSAEPREQLTRMSQTDAHQGVLAIVGQRQLFTLEELLERPHSEKGSLPSASGECDDAFGFLLALDGIEDPHNFGALLRTVDAAGLGGVILPERRSAPLSAVAAKTSAGAMEHVRIARVTNLVRSLEQAKQAGFWVVGLDERGSKRYTDFDFRLNCVLVLGREGAGMHDLTRRTCDHLLRIPMAGQVASLNVSVAGAVVMFEAMRQRRSPTESNPASTKSPKNRPTKGLGA